MDRGIETTEADQVIEVVDVVRVPVVLGCVTEVGVLDTDLLELLTAPPSSWSTLLADTMGQLVNHTSFQFNGTVVDFFTCFAIIYFISLYCNLQSNLELFYTYDYRQKTAFKSAIIVVFKDFRTLWALHIMLTRGE